jgi:type VI protein secretion system component VasK
VTGVLTAAWAVALVVVLIARDALPAGSRWWVWTCVTGLAMGLFALWYVPVLKRGRRRAAKRRGQPSGVDSGYVSRDSGSKTVSSTETPGSSTKS